MINPVNNIRFISALEDSLPNVCFWSPRASLRLRQRALAHDQSVIESVDELVKRADSAMKLGPFSVVDKKIIPPSGDKHDYSSLGAYYWPNPATSNGLPWIRRDGKINPDYLNGELGDAERIVRLASTVVTLSRAYYLTNRQLFADRAASLLRTWFIDRATRMNPHARYGGRFPGHWDGVSYGIHGTRTLMDVADAIGLLRGSHAWTSPDQDAMTDWFEQYTNWLTTSDLGKQESLRNNNHGIGWDCLVIRLAIFVGKHDLARCVLEDVPSKRIMRQIEPNGEMPYELARAAPWVYMRYALEWFFKLSTLGDRLGVNLWYYRSGDGRSIRVAFDYLINSICKNDGSIDDDILAKAAPDRLGPLLQIAARIYQNPDYLQIMQRIGTKRDLVLQESSVNGNLSADDEIMPT